jgi:hypothetical protein
MTLVTLPAKADTKFHFHDRVSFTRDFYGKCEGTVISFKAPDTYELESVYCNGYFYMGRLFATENELTIVPTSD